MSREFPLCESIGLEVNRADKYKPYEAVVSVAAIEHLLASGVRMYGKQFKNEGGWALDEQKTSFDTHECLAIDIKPIEKPPRKRELSESQIREAFKKLNFENNAGIEVFINWIFGLDINECEHKNSSISEPHLAGARVCNDCGAYKPRGSSPFGPQPAPEAE